MATAVRLVVVTTALLAGCGSPPTRHRPFPQVTSLDGSILSPLGLVTIVADNEQADASFLFDFSDLVGRSGWWRSVGSQYHLGGASSLAHLTGPAIVADLTDHDVFQYITDVVAAHGGPARDGNTLYLLYLPAGVTVVERGVPNTGCSSFGAYHAGYGPLGDNLAVVQRCSTTDPLNVMTVAASHEIIEAATDPNGRGYVLPRAAARRPWEEDIWISFNLGGEAEVGDLCEGTFYFESGFYFQRVWSNAAAAGGGDPCVPGLREPYYSTSARQDWTPMTAGGLVSIPVTGWSAGILGNWGLKTFVQGSSPGFSAGFPTTGTTLNDGLETMLTVTAPASAPSGSFAVITVASTRPPAPAGIRPLTDGAHLAPLGVYIP